MRSITIRTPNVSTFIFAVVVAALCMTQKSHAGGLACKIGTLVEQVIAGDAAASQKAVSELRQLGQPALDALCDAYAKTSADQVKTPTEDTKSKVDRLRTSIDAVAKQRDAFKSRLFWHTDLQNAIDEAQRTNRPILSLRLLGHLDDDLSCANSRYFRTVLYSNAAVSNYLRDHFVLHWQTVRPVPVITIDFGDGRKIERTITGNSIHYVLDSSGEIIDAIPGLYGPNAFLRAVQSAEGAVQNIAATSSPIDKGTLFRRYHMDSLDAMTIAWNEDMSRANAGAGVVVSAAPNKPVQAQAPAPAILAASRAHTKEEAEAPMLSAAFASPFNMASLDSPINDELWTRIASLHPEDAQLDQASIELMRSKTPTVPAEVAARVTRAKRQAEDPFMRVLRNFQQSIALDTVRNEHLLHRRIHEWLAESAGTVVNKNQFNERVYSELFLTPLNDPWMGLATNDAYAALDQGGLLSVCK